jgi:predicted HAD superfamily Cof-like phosphohydrolase
MSHDDRTPAGLADTAAENIRAINHELYNGLPTAGDAYSLVGNLARLASMLPQALNMTRGAVQKLERGGQLRSDQDRLVDDLARTYDALEQAAVEAQALYESIARAQGGLGHIGMQDGGAS